MTLRRHGHAARQAARDRAHATALAEWVIWATARALIYKRHREAAEDMVTNAIKASFARLIVIPYGRRS